MLPQARYFPVDDAPMRMLPGLHRFGACFGNGHADQHYFSWDTEAARYLAAKRQCLARHPERFAVCGGSTAREILHHVGAWMYERWRHEREAQGAQVDPITPADRRAPLSRIAAFHRELGLRLSEDYVILTQSQSGSHDAIILHHVCFPSRWRPERSLGRDFRTIHAPVPNFEGVMVRADAWVRTLVSRGPYVRFVWTVTAAPALDQHPDIAHRTSTLDLSEAFLRVERQVSVPFPHQHSCLFLIRVYVYPLQSLKDTQLQTLASALHQMPEAIRRYKGLEHSWRGFAAAIERRLR